MALTRSSGASAVLAVLIPAAIIYLTPPQETVGAEAAKAFNFTDFLSGQWTVEVRQVKPGYPKQEVSDDEFDRDDEITIGNYILNKKNGGYLEGIYYENITNSPVDIKNALRVRVDPVSGSAGVFKTARAETNIFEESAQDEPDLQYRTLFEYDFETYKNGMKVSWGDWHGRRKGTYHFAVASQSSFLLSVYPKVPEKGEALSFQTMTAHKDVAKSFWDTYGFQMLLVLMIFIPRFFLNSGRSRYGQKAPAAAAAAPAAAPSGKKDK